MFKIAMKDAELFAELEIAHYEFNSYANILNDMKNSDNGYNDEYWSTWKEYIKVLGEYETLKEKLRIQFVVPIVGEGYDGNWEANFDENMIYIYGNDQIE